MKIGLRAHDYGKLPLDVLFKSISEDGFNGIQLAPIKAIEGVSSLDDLDESLLKDIKATLEKYQIEIPVYGSYVELGHLDPEVRQMQVNKFLKAMDIAKFLGAKCIGSETTHMDLNTPEADRRVAFEGLLDSIRQIVKKGEEIGLDVAIEPVAVHTLNTPELAKEMLDVINSERLGIIFDPVNLLTATNIIEQDILWDRAFECFKGKVCALHMKGVRLNAEGALEKTNLQNSDVHFDKVINWLKENHPDITILREEIKQVEAREDWAFINSFLK